MAGTRREPSIGEHPTTEEDGMTSAVVLPRRTHHSGGLGRLAVVIGALGIIAAVVLSAASLLAAWRAPDSFDRTVIGGAVTVRLRAGEQAVVYDESGSTHALADVGLTVTSPTGATVSVEPYQGR